MSMNTIEVKTKPTSKKERRTHPKVLGAGLLAAVGVAMGVQAVENNRPPSDPVLNGPHKEYIVESGDTAWNILNEAYPDRDARALIDVIDKQLPEEDRAQHLLRPGEVLSFGVDAKIGEVTDPSMTSSAPRG